MKHAFGIALAFVLGSLLGRLFVTGSKPDKPTAETRSLLASVHNDKWIFTVRPGAFFNDQCFTRHDIRLVRGYWWASVEEKTDSHSLNHRFSLHDLILINDQLSIKLDEHEQIFLDHVSRLK